MLPTLTLLLVLAARAAGPAVALPPGTSPAGWSEALRLAGLQLAPSPREADLVCRAATGGWEIRLRTGDRLVARVSTPASQREREDLALLAASLAADLGLGSRSSDVEPGHTAGDPPPPDHFQSEPPRAPGALPALAAAAPEAGSTALPPAAPRVGVAPAAH
ncbi:MAG: hypothetical protein ABIO70_17560, partial [Pseudomonadota bacterium]